MSNAASQWCLHACNSHLVVRRIHRHGVGLRLVLRHLPLLLEVALVAGNAELDVVADNLAQLLDLAVANEHEPK